MNVNRSSVFWGVLLIGGGALALAQQMGYMNQIPANIWTWIFALISLAALAMYVMSGLKEWGWLFPMGVFGGLAITILFALSGSDNPAMASPLFFGLLIPFTAAYLTDRQRNWWALIPGGVMLFLALTLLLVENVGGEWVGALFLFLIGLSFLVVYLNNHQRTWALLVAYIMFVLSLAPAMASGGGKTSAYYGSIFLLAVALPFFVVYFRSASNWWAIIPAGVMTTLALIAAFAIAGWIREGNNGYANAFVMFGIALTFAVVWLRHSKDWAKIVAIFLALLAVAFVFLASYMEILWPVVIILAGGYLLFTAMRPKAMQ